MKLGAALSWVLVAACGFDAPKLGAMPDSGGGGPDACTTFSAQLDTCQLTNTTPLALSGRLTFDTDTGVLKDSSEVAIPVFSFPVMTHGAEVRAIAATTVNFAPDTSLRAVGVRGFAIVASDTVTLQANAIIDVSQGGAGHRGSCGDEAATGGADDNGGGAGGGGGGFGAAGGDGGNGDNDGGQSTGGAGGKIAPMIPDGPFGGCPGASGGKNTGTNNDGGAGGAGGGAVYLVSAVSIAIGPGAGIRAGGAGGGGGERESGFGDAGGGGGGSGGSIFLEAPIIRSLGTLAANGGGGGEGSGNMAAGKPGELGPFSTAQAAGGKDGSPTGVDGGAGGAVTNPAGAKPADVQSGGGGGGGGGGGVIRIKSLDAQLGPNVSPAPV